MHLLNIINELLGNQSTAFAARLKIITYTKSKFPRIKNRQERNRYDIILPIRRLRGLNFHPVPELNLTFITSPTLKHIRRHTIFRLSRCIERCHTYGHDLTFIDNTEQLRFSTSGRWHLYISHPVVFRV